MAVIAVFSTFPNADIAASVARVLVDERLCACVNIVPGVRSIYRWQGAICDEPKSSRSSRRPTTRLAALQARLVELHPYEVPEALAVSIAGGHAAYLAWVSDAV